MSIVQSAQVIGEVNKLLPRHTDTKFAGTIAVNVAQIQIGCEEQLLHFNQIRHLNSQDLQRLLERGFEPRGQRESEDEQESEIGSERREP